MQFWAVFVATSTLFSFLGFGISELLKPDHNTKAWIALSAVLLVSIGFLALHTVTAIIRHRRRYPNGYSVISTTTTLSTLDGSALVYEVFKHVQIKRSFLADVTHSFTWSGTERPVVSSDLQTVRETLSQANGNTSVMLGFDRIKRYDDVAVIHFRMKASDADKKSNPVLGVKVADELQVIDLTVQLLHASSSYQGSADFERFPIGVAATAANTQPLKTIAFNTQLKKFEITYPNPAPGYVYQLRWTRP